MKKSELTTFWIGLFGSAILSYLLYRLLRPPTSITPKPLAVRVADVRPIEKGKGSEVSKDSLVKIRGIGPVTEKSLNDAGIFTFSQLANTKATDLVKFSGKRWDPKDWIEQAKELS